VYAIFKNSEKYGVPIARDLSILEWPWTWHRISFLLEVLDGVRQRCYMKDAPMPPKDIIFDADAVEKWIKDHKGEEKNDADL